LGGNKSSGAKKEIKKGDFQSQHPEKKRRSRLPKFFRQAAKVGRRQEGVYDPGKNTTATPRGIKNSETLRSDGKKRGVSQSQKYLSREEARK